MGEPGGEGAAPYVPGGPAIKATPTPIVATTSALMMKLMKNLNAQPAA